jgi:hypothetical protein
MRNLSCTLACTLALFFVSQQKPAFADDSPIDKVYHPYVDALEKELEYRTIVQDRQERWPSPAQLHKLSLGTAFSDRWFGEIYLVGQKPRQGSFNLQAYEVELKWQLTEQGEYFADWGLLFEFEHETDRDFEELSIGLLSEKEWGRWSGTANFRITQEWGNDVIDEFETSFAWQHRYRYSQSFEPGVEFYAGQTAVGVGPVLQGTFNTGIRRNLHWEAGLILGLDEKSPDQTFRFLLEFEF